MDNLAQVPLTLCTTKAGLAVGTTTTMTTANTQLYAIKGKAYTKAGTSNEATPTLDSNTGVAFLPIGLNKAGVFVICRDSGGNLRAVQGQIVDYTDDGVFKDAPQFPVIPDSLCPIGYELVKVISTGSAWTFGASNQASQTGITKVLVDLMTMVDRPQVS
jgi:hypothetical protein